MEVKSRESFNFIEVGSRQTFNFIEIGSRKQEIGIKKQIFVFIALQK